MKGAIKMKIQKIKYEKIMILAAFAILSFLFIFPIINKGIVAGHDTAFHLTRFKNLCNELSWSNIRPHIFSEAYGGSGYATGIFYPDLFFYPFAILYKLGVSYELSFDLYLFFAKFFTTISYYFC